MIAGGATVIDLAAWGVTQAEAQALLARQTCPVCGEGPWKSPLNHVSRKHGIDRFTMRDVCGLTLTVSVLDPELRERFVEHGRTVDMTQVNHAGKPRRKQRWTRAGREGTQANIEAWNETDEAAAQRTAAAQASKQRDAVARQSASLRARWEAMSDDERRAATAHIPRDSDTQRAKSLARWDRQGRQPCGTVAAYKRGCRCEPCRDAKRRSRG
jgi:hypothetical protein